MTFIPVAEETGMIGDLSMSIIRKAMIEAKELGPEAYHFGEHLAGTAKRSRGSRKKSSSCWLRPVFRPAGLEVEITESSLFKNLSLAQSIVGSLKNQGIKIALDDFGTGYSSLAHLRALPFDRIKIDRSFVSSMLENAESAAIVSAIAGLGASLDVPITAEGIEDEQIIGKLKALGCSKGQGWFFGQPMNIDQARSLLAQKDLLPARRRIPEPPAAEEQHQATRKAS